MDYIIMLCIHTLVLVSNGGAATHGFLQRQSRSWEKADDDNDDDRVSACVCGFVWLFVAPIEEHHGVSPCCLAQL